MPTKPTTTKSSASRSSPSTPGRKAAATTSGASTKSTPAAPDPLELVRPLVRVRQMRDFTTKRVTKAELDAITEVARWSGSSRNEQPWRFIALRDSETIRQIAELGLPQTRGLPTATAAIAIVLPEEPGRELSRSFDDGRVAERIFIAAHMLGLGGGISRVRSDVREPINELLRLPPGRSVRTIVAIGHPSADARAPKSAPGAARLPRDQVVFEGAWPDRLRDQPEG